MKAFRTLIVAICTAAAACGTAAAQDTAWHLNFDMAIGLTHYHNYSALSLRADPQPFYTGFTSQLSFGLEHRSTAFTLRYANTTLNTSAIDVSEVANLQEISLLVRTKVQLAPQLELLAGGGLGLMMVDNIWFQPIHTAHRYGLSVMAELELRYRVSRHICLMARASLGYGRLLANPSSMPDPAVTNPRNGLFSTSLLGGVSIGIPVKTKHLTSPQALNVPAGAAPLLVTYND